MSLVLSPVAAGLCTPCPRLFYRTKATCKQTDGQGNVYMLFVLLPLEGNSIIQDINFQFKGEQTLKSITGTIQMNGF